MSIRIRVGLLTAHVVGRAQVGGVRADLTPIVETDAVLGATYGAAMAFVYGLLGLIVILSPAATLNVGG